MRKICRGESTRYLSTDGGQPSAIRQHTRQSFPSLVPGRQNEKARQLTSQSFGVPLGCVSLLTWHLFGFFDRGLGNQQRVYRSLA